MIAQSHRTDTTPAVTPSAPSVRPTVPAPFARPTDLAPPTRPSVQDPSGFGFAKATVQPTSTTARGPVRRRPDRSPRRSARWPIVVGVVSVPAAGVAGYLAAVLSSGLPIQILAYTVVGGVVVIKVHGPVRAVMAAISAAIAKVGSR